MGRMIKSGGFPGGLLCLLAVLLVGSLVWASGGSSGGVTMSISTGTTPANPQVVAVGQYSTVTFMVSLYTGSDSHEKPAKNVKSRTYTLDAGYGGIIESVTDNNGTTAVNKPTDTFTENGALAGTSETITANVHYRNTGKQTVTLKGSALLTSGSTVNADPNGKVAVYPVKAKIEINNSTSPSNDLVMYFQGPILSPDPRTMFPLDVPCRVQLIGQVPSTVKINIQNAQSQTGQAGFATTATAVPSNATADGLEMQTNGSNSGGPWTTFYIGGKTKSQAKNDAKIEAIMPGTNGSDHPIGPVKLTVFSCKNALMELDQGSAYIFPETPKNNPTTLSITVAGYPNAHQAIYNVASASLRPNGLDTTAPQLNNLRVGVVQNALKGTGTKVIWQLDSKNPFTFNAGVKAGSTQLVSEYETLDISFPTAFDDYLNNPPIEDNVTNEQPAHLGHTFAGDDTPGTVLSPLSLDFPEPPLGTAHYQLASLSIHDSFLDWCTVVELQPGKPDAVLEVLKEGSWQDNVISTGGPTQKVVINYSDKPVANSPLPVTSPPSAIQEYKSLKGQYVPSGKVYTFTK